MSSIIRRIVGNRLLVIVLALAVTGFGLTAMSVPTAHACPPQQIEYTYFTDASHTVSCGWKIITCSCGVYKGGCATEFYEIDWSEC